MKSWPRRCAIGELGHHDHSPTDGMTADDGLRRFLKDISQRIDPSS